MTPSSLACLFEKLSHYAAVPLPRINDARGGRAVPSLDCLCSPTNIYIGRKKKSTMAKLLL